MNHPQVRSYKPAMQAAWDRLVAEAPGGTVLHSRRFLDYHGTRFHDLSLVCLDSDGELLGVFPIVSLPADPAVAVSHAGSSFGGIVMRRMEHETQCGFLLSAADALRDAGISRLIYKSVPSVLIAQPDDGLLPLLHRHGVVVKCDLWSILRLPGSERDRKYWRRRMVRGQREGLTIQAVSSEADWHEFHQILSARLRERYATGPVHSVQELADLHRRLGGQSRAIIVREPAGKASAVMWFIDYGCGTLHNQYVAATERGRQLGATSYGFANILGQALGEGFHQFSFGRSTLEDGWSVNANLLRFKEQFGAGLACQLQFDIDISKLVTTSKAGATNSAPASGVMGLRPNPQQHRASR